MRVFLTGATGLVGHHVAQALNAQGPKLRLLVRKTGN
jgi:dihydroflavonol-4-reductase